MNVRCGCYVDMLSVNCDGNICRYVAMKLGRWSFVVRYSSVGR
jgi:hypothetical protein